MSYCDYTIESGDDCARPAHFKFIVSDLAHYACQEHDQPLYKWLRETDGMNSVIISEFIPFSERAAEHCQHVGCRELVMPAMHGDLNLLLCQEHWAPWCDAGDCSQPAQFELHIQAPHEGYEPSEPRWACADHLYATAGGLMGAWRGLLADYGSIKVERITRP